MVISISPVCINGFSAEFPNVVRLVLPTMSMRSKMGLSVTQHNNLIPT